MKTQWKMESGLVCFTVRANGFLVYASDYMDEDQANDEAASWLAQSGYVIEFSEEDIQAV
jgi:hypothetical protein